MLFYFWDWDRWIVNSGFWIYAIAIFIAVDFETGIFSAPVFLFTGLFFSFRLFRRWQLTKNIPSSKIRSVPMGNLVEVKGKGNEETLREAPNGKECVFYRYILEEYQWRGKNKEWVTVGTGNSPRYFYIEDGTGRMMVDTEDANLKLTEDSTVYLKDSDDLSDKTKEIIEEHGYGGWGEEGEFLFWDYETGNDLKLTQYSVSPGENVYVLGRADTRNENGEETPVMVRDEENDVFIVADSSEKTIAGSMLFKTCIHFLAAVIGLFWSIWEILPLL